MHTVADKDHAKLGPSSWDRWSQCPGSVALSDGQPNTTSKYAAEGSVAHEVADRVLREEVMGAGDLLGQTFTIEGFDIVVDDEMVEAVDLYATIVRDKLVELGEDAILLPEQQVPIGHLTGEVGATGTSDAIIISGKRMVVIDLKYGKGVRVNAAGNGQGQIYALGALHKLGMVYEDVEEVEVMIIQPRIEDGISFEVLTIGELEEFKDQVELAAAAVALASQSFNPREFEGQEEYERWLREGSLDVLNPGEKQCKFCPAAAICPALKAEASKSLALLAPAATADDFADLSLPKQASAVAVNPDASGEKLAEFLRAVPLIEAAITAVRAEAERRLFAGEDVPGFYLGVGRKGNRKWTGDVDVEQELKKRLGSQAYEKKVISVPTAEKLFKAKPKTWAKIKDLIVQPDGKPSVCMEGDKNPRYEISTASDFADLSAQTEAERLLG